MELAHFGPNPVYGNGGTSGSPDSALLHLPGAPRADKGDSTVPSGDNLALGGYTLKVQYKRGDTREVDISCDSAFMLCVMRKVGQAIHDKYYW
eukprot:scaffold10860_cov148-Skeletonema_marinoi.AAC.1